MTLRFTCFFWLIASVATAEAGGLRGMVAVRLANGAIGAAVQGAELRFTRVDAIPGPHKGRDSVTVRAGERGMYETTLAPGRYYVIASHPAYQDYISSPGFAVVSASFGTCNVFLRDPAATTVLVVRHAEKVATDPDQPLSDEGIVRARMLMNTLVMSGATAVYSTDTLRTRGTVSPYAKLFGLPITTYDDVGALAAVIGREHRGDVVLVAGHGNTVDDIMSAFGAAVPTTGDIEEFDNLFVVTKTESSANAVNLQYGLDSLPDAIKQSTPMTTLLLARNVSGSNPPQAQTILHALKKADIAAIRYHGARDLVQPLATALGITPTSFTAASRTGMLDELLRRFSGRVVLVVGDREDHTAILRRLGADLTTPQLVVPFDIPLKRLETAPETANLVFATTVEPRRARALLLRFVPW